jgi:hypothetical protein
MKKRKIKRLSVNCDFFSCLQARRENVENEKRKILANKIKTI